MIEEANDDRWNVEKHGYFAKITPVEIVESVVNQRLARTISYLRAAEQLDLLDENNTTSKMLTFFSSSRINNQQIAVVLFNNLSNEDKLILQVNYRTSKCKSICN